MTQALRTTIKKVNGDCLTPILIFNRLQGTRKFLLESSSKHESSGRYSFIGANPRKTYSGSETTLTEHSHLTGKTYSYEGNLIHSLKQVMPRISNHTEYPFTGGAIGYIRQMSGDSTLPEVNFHIYDTIIIFDHVTDELIVIHTNIDAELQTPNIDQIIEQLLNGNTTQQHEGSLSPFTEQLSFEQFNEKIEQAKHAIAQGAATQLIISRKLHATYTGDSFALYRKLRVNMPAPYLYYIEFDDHTVIGSSPESLISVNNSFVKATLDIGQIERGTTAAEDETNANALLSKESTLQTHDAFIEQTKLDLKSVVQGLQIAQPLKAIRYEHAIHAQSTLIGALSPVAHAIDALAAILPATSVTGLPKQQAIQTLTAMQAEQRDLFGSAIGYIGFNGQLDFALAVRALVLQQQTVTVQIGTKTTAETNAKQQYEQSANTLQSTLSPTEG